MCIGNMCQKQAHVHMVQQNEKNRQSAQQINPVEPVCAAATVHLGGLNPNRIASE